MTEPPNIPERYFRVYVRNDRVTLEPLVPPRRPKHMCYPGQGPGEPWKTVVHVFAMIGAAVNIAFVLWVAHQLWSGYFG